MLAMVLAAVPVSAANLNNFTITDFNSQLALTKNDQNRSLLETRETITAVFPPNQNRGIERVVPKKYDGHSVSLNVRSVTDQAGRAIQYQTRSVGGNEIIRIGNPNEYVSGKKTYVITYQQQDVTRFFDDTNRDEFYWDINGTEWKVPIENISAELVVAPELAARLSGDLACYQGGAGQSKRCAITRDEQTISASLTEKLTRPGENMTIAVGFMPGTFAAYQPSAWERFFAVALPIWIGLQIAAIVVALILLTLWWRWVRRTGELGTIVPEYLPPKNASVQIAAGLGDGTRNTFSAQLLDLAVRHYIKLYQTKEKGLFRPAEYEIELTKSPSKLRREEQAFLRTLFDADGTVGARFNMKKLKSNYKTQRRVARRLERFAKQLKTSSSWMRFAAAKKAQYKRWMLIALLASLLLLSPGILLLAGALAIMMSGAYQLNDDGLALRRYLAGLRQYIDVAETERLKMLQSPEGAEKVGNSIGPDNTKQLVKLYEKVLPYAVLFGQEKQWGKTLGNYYDQLGRQPDWYSGQTVFNAAVFSSVIHDFGASGSYGSSTSSSSGGSSGGGYSGGGGGGGGGGGW